MVVWKVGNREHEANIILFCTPHVFLFCFEFFRKKTSGSLSPRPKWRDSKLHCFMPSKATQIWQLRHLRRCKLGPFRLGRALELLSDKTSQATGIGCWLLVWRENGTGWAMNPDEPQVLRLPSDDQLAEGSWRIIGVNVVALWGVSISVWNL